MNIDPIDKKNILKDPVGIFFNEYENSPDINQIKILHEQCLKLKHNFKDHKSLCKKISREIGEAKKNKKDSVSLFIKMKEHSAQVKSISSELKSLEDKIITLFLNNASNTSITQEKKQPKKTNAQIDLSTVSVSLLNTPNKQWNTYVENSPTTSIYHKSEWKELIYKTFGHNSYYFYAQDKNNNIVGILPLTHLKSMLFGNFLVSIPYFNYGGAKADHPLIEEKLVEAANSFSQKLNSTHIEYRDDIARKNLPVKMEKVNMILSLKNSEKELWDSFTPKLRAQIKRPQREMTTNEQGQQECLNDFYTVFAQNMRDLGTPVYSKSFFKNILNSFPKSTQIIIIKLNNKPVAAAFLIGHKDTIEIPWASTIKSVNHLSINMLLYWNVLCYAVSKKYKKFDFGRSSVNSGTYNFKKQWGAKPRQSYWHYHLNDNNEMPSLNPSNPKYALVITIWKKLPLFLTKIIGPFIVKNLP